MADRIVVLNQGRVEQFGSPLELYNNPVNQFVAGFIGSPKMNFIGGAEALSRGAKTIGVRPEHMKISKESGVWTGKVTVSEQLGSYTFLHVDVPDIGHVTARTSGDEMYSHGDTVHLSPEQGRVYRFNESGTALGRG